MALPQLITWVNGLLQGILPIQSSAGSSSAGSIPALNSSGLVDPTMLGGDVTFGSVNATTGSFSGALTVQEATAAGNPVTLGQVATPSNGGYTNVTSSRAIGTVYTNSNERPLLVQVLVYTGATTGDGLQLLVNGVEVSACYTPTALQIYFVLTAIVPPGQTYEVTNAVGTNSFSNWSEY